MDAATPSKRARTSSSAAAASIAATPQKLKNTAAATLFATPEKPTGAGAADLSWTPDKTEQRPLLRRAAGKGAVALSVKEVRRAALGLRRPDRGRAEVAQDKEDALESVARELGVGAGAGRSPVKRRPEVKLPQSYEMLCEFFNCFESSTRLLRMKGSKATFPNICASIQNLADRRFTYGNLAQLKYIMPEAIVINKILLRDDKTCCMKPDLQVNLLVDSVEDSALHKGETRYSALRRMFRQRLVDFFRKHPEGDEIPEQELPHPFTQTKPSVAQIKPRAVPEAEAEAEAAVPPPHPAAMSHMPPSFKRMFSQRSSSTCPASPLPSAASPLSSKGQVLRLGASDGTPAKLASTPGLQTPKNRATPATQTQAKRSARAKLFMTPTKDARRVEDKSQSTSTSAAVDDDELLSFLPKSLLQSVKHKEKRALEEKETGLADQVQRQKLISSLPATFDIVFLIYQSRQRTVLPKQELVDRIVERSPKIVDKGEIEEQLRLLQELVPEWISEKTALSGDALCCVDTSLSQSEVRQRLKGAE